MRIAIIEPYFHAEVLRTYLNLLAESKEHQVYVFMRRDVWLSYINEFVPFSDNLHFIFQDSDLEIPAFIEQHLAIINDCSVVIFLTIQNHFKFFAGLNLRPKKLLVLHNVHTFLKPSKNINWGLHWVFWAKLFRSIFIHRDFKYLPIIVQKMDGFIVGNASIEQYIYQNELLPQGKTLFTLPFTYFSQPPKLPKIDENNSEIRITITGAVSEIRKDYNVVFDALNLLLEEKKVNIRLELLGNLQELKGQKIAKKFKALEKEHNFKLVTYAENVDQLLFDNICYQTHIFIVPALEKVVFSIFREKMGQSTLTGGLGDSIRYGIPGIVPHFIQTDDNADGFIKKYTDSKSLKLEIIQLIDKKQYQTLKINAENALINYSKTKLQLQLNEILQTIVH
jgi:hypothetical protein